MNVHTNNGDNVKYKKIYYEPKVLEYPLGKKLKEIYSDIEWIPIISHNNIEELRKRNNDNFVLMKHYLIVGIRKTHQYVTNQKASDYLVPFTSSGCSAMCLYCYLVCNYNKCSYLRIYANSEDIIKRLIKKSLETENECTFEIGSNSDLILENQITGNLDYVIEEFGKHGRGMITFPTKFSMVDSLLNLNHCGKTYFRMSLNPQEIISQVEFGTSNLDRRIEALNKMEKAGYKIGIVIAPVIFVPKWEEIYLNFLNILKEKISISAQKKMTIEVIFMTYSYIHRAINEQAFPNAIKLYNEKIMTSRGRKYVYKKEYRLAAEQFLRTEIELRFGKESIMYIV